MNRERYFVTRVAIAAVIVVGALIWIFPGIQQILRPDRFENSGPRGLVIVATQGGNYLLRMDVRQYYDAPGEARVVFALSAVDDGITYGPGGTATPVPFQIVFVGDGFSEGVKCGGESAPQWEFSQLAQGIQTAVDVDAISPRASATGLGEDLLPDKSNSADVMAKAHDDKFFVHGGWLWPYSKGRQIASSRSVLHENGQEYLFAEECILPGRSAWKAIEGKSFANSPKSSLRPYQINWTSINQNTDFHEQLGSSMRVGHGANQTLVEHYPEMRSTDNAWVYDNRVDWVGERGGRNNIAFTDQPFLLLANRDAEDKRSIYMLWSGVLLGLIGTVIVQTISWIAEFLETRRE